MVGRSPYRARDVLTLGIGLTFLLSHGGLLVGRWLDVTALAWAPWAAAMIAGGVVGGVVAEPFDGAGAGVFAAGFGGGLFVFGNFLDQGLAVAVRNSLFVMAAFALVGAFAGGVAGFVRGRMDPPDAGDGEGTDDESPEGTGASAGEPGPER